MPAAVGNVKVNVVQSGGTLLFGDSFANTAESASKTFAGSGSFNTGDRPVTNTIINNVHTEDADIIDNQA